MLTEIKDFLERKAKEFYVFMRPFVDLATEAVIALYSSFSTFKSSVEFVPVMLSGLTILTTIPLLSYFLPSVALNTTLLTFILLSVSLAVGYTKYHELKLRKKLDAQTTKHGTELSTFQAELSTLKTAQTYDKKRARKKEKELKETIENNEKEINEIKAKLEDVIKQLDDFKAQHSASSSAPSQKSTLYNIKRNGTVHVTLLHPAGEQIKASADSAQRTTTLPSSSPVPPASEPPATKPPTATFKSRSLPRKSQSRRRVNY